jgi:hypothetical protein
MLPSAVLRLIVSQEIADLSFFIHLTLKNRFIIENNLR